AVEQASSVRLDPQKVLEVIRFRRTIRQFQETEIPAEVISQILEAGRLTHTAENKQDVTYIVIDKEKASLEQQAVKFFRRLKPVANLFSSMARRTVIDDHFFFFQAPVAIVIAAKEEINGALAAQNMEFVAEANGLGVLYSGFFTMVVNHSRSLRAALHIPKGKKAVTTLVLGYP
ncbi:MAG: nitroreductase family protein, partial [[Clostridium] innocuum]